VRLGGVTDPRTVPMESNGAAGAGKRRFDLGQAGRFGMVGVLNTVLDFGTFSVLRVLGTPLVASNLASTSLGMSFSFVANRRFVFSADGGWRRQAVLFFSGTAFSMYVLQSLVIVALTRSFPAPLDAAMAVSRWLGLRSEAWTVLIRSNAAKMAATIVSTTWNFFFYRFLVFGSIRRTTRRPGSPTAVE